KIDAPEEKKKPQLDYCQLALSIVLLTVIVILVSLIYHYYHLHILSVFIFDRIKIVEADRVMEVMSVNDATGYRAPLVKIRLGVEFPVHTKHTDCTDYLKYLVDATGEIRKSEDKRKRRDLEKQITGPANSDAIQERTTSKPEGRMRNKNNSRRRKKSSRVSARRMKLNQGQPLPDAAALKSNAGAPVSSIASNEVETGTENPGFWSIFTDIFTPIQGWTDSPSNVFEFPESSVGNKKYSENTNQDGKHIPGVMGNSGSIGNSDQVKALTMTKPLNDEGSMELNDKLNPTPLDEEKTSQHYKYSSVEISRPSLSQYFSGDVLEETISVEDFPFGVYDTDPFHFENQFSNMQCVDFKGRARLQLTHRPPLDDVDCFSVHWESSSPDLVMKDCFEMDGNTTGVWWGMGDVTGGAMPLTKLSEVSDAVLYSGEILHNTVGGLLRRIWISSEGILVSIPFAARALLSVNALHSPRREFCLHSERHVDFSHPTQRDKLDLDYTLCVAPNVPTLLSKLPDIERMDNIEYATSKWHRSLHLLPDDVELYHVSETITDNTLREVANRFSCPLWRPWIPHNQGDIDQDDVLAYAESIVLNVQNTCGFVLLPTSWQSKLGSLDFDSKRFPNPALLLESLHRKGLVLALTISSLIDVEAPSFKNTSVMDLLIRQINSTLPILVSTSKTKSAAVLDFTNPNTVNWYASELMKLKQKYGIDQFHLSPTSTQSLPPFRKFYSSHPNPDYAIKQFIKAVSRVRAPISTNTAIIPVSAPTFLTASYGDASWEMLEMLPNRILTISAIGGNLVDGGVVGGWSTQPGHIPDRELYVRWMGVSIFLPVMELSVLPSMYDPTVLSYTNELMKLREDLVIPRLRKNLNESLTNNLPLVSPLAMVFPKDLKSLPIGDQWFVGKDLMVAPVLQRGARARDIYLPPGIWKDGSYDKLLKGKRWLKSYRVMMGKVPHFTLITPERGPKSQKSRREKLSRRARESSSA
ncbi:Glycoside hydrolase family 31, partial [Trinorchestia longiramus]